MSKVTYTIPSIHCDHCLHTIQMEVGELEGVTSVAARLAETDVTIEFEPPASEEGIKALLREINYPVKELTQIN